MVSLLHTAVFGTLTLAKPISYRPAVKLQICSNPPLSSHFGSLVIGPYFIPTLLIPIDSVDKFISTRVLTHQVSNKILWRGQSGGGHYSLKPRDPKTTKVEACANCDKGWGIPFGLIETNAAPPLSSRTIRIITIDPKGITGECDQYKRLAERERVASI